MADVRKLVTIDSAGTVTTVKDLEVSSSYQAVRGSFAVKAPDRQTAMVGSGRRYAGQGAVAESHQNGEVSWKALVKGATSDVCLQNVESMIAAFEQLEYPGLHLEWRPDGATYSTYYEVRGPARWQPAYDWAQFQGAGSMLVDIAVPVAPLARGANQTICVVVHCPEHGCARHRCRWECPVEGSGVGVEGVGAGRSGVRSACVVAAPRCASCGLQRAVLDLRGRDGAVGVYERGVGVRGRCGV